MTTPESDTDNPPVRGNRIGTWWKRWCPVLITALVSLALIWCTAKDWSRPPLRKNLHDVLKIILSLSLQWNNLARVMLQVGTTAFATVFVGTLTRNTSQTQADAAAKLSREQDSRSRSSDLMAHQASAIDHLGSSSPVIQAAAITEMVWLIRGWRHLVNDTIDAGKPEKDEERRWREHAQELVELAYRDNLHDETGFTPREIIQARARGLWTLHDKLQDNFTELSFSNSKLTEAALTDANLTDANLYGADLYGANLWGATLTGATLTDANLYGADLTKADLTEANLWGATLTGATLTGANLWGATLWGADLGGANLTGADLTKAELDISEYDEFTKFPADFDPDAHSMIYVGSPA